MVAPRFVDQSTSVADILASSVTDGEIRVNLGYLNEGKGIGADSPYWGVDGFFSRPNDPNPDAPDGGAAMAFYIVDGDTKRIVATRDNRFSSVSAALLQGDRAISSRGSARFILKAGNPDDPTDTGEDSTTMYTVSEGEDLDMIVHLNGKGSFGEFRVGASFMKMTSDKITISVAGGKCVLTLTEKGLQIDGENFLCATSGGHLGVLAPLVPPVPGVNAIVIGPGGPAGVGSSKWTCTP